MWTRLFNKLRSLRRDDAFEHDLSDELDFHRAMFERDRARDGVEPDAAAQEARRRIGNVTIAREDARRAWTFAWIEELVRDVRLAIRGYRRSPGFALTVVLTLALGIGANAAVFSAVRTVLLQPLPFPNGDRLMRLSQQRDGTAETPIAPARLEDWNQMSSTFDAITGYYAEDVSDTSGELPESIRRAFVAPRFLDVWGVAPQLGRGFTSADHTPGATSAVLISDRYWRSRFAADPTVLTQTVRIGMDSFAIAGVMPETFRFPDRRVDLWFPVALSGPLAQARHTTWYVGIGRLAPGITVEQARANLGAVQSQLGEQYPATDAAISVVLAPLKDSMIGDVRGSLWLLFGAVSVLLLIACTNIAALWVSRTIARRQETSVRLALGASRASVARHVLIETAVLAVVGGVLGVIVATGLVAVLRSSVADLPRLDEVVLDRAVLLYTAATAVVVTLLCGLLPAVRSAQGSASGVMRDTARTQVSTRHSLQWLLVGTQVALSVMLLTGSALLVRSIQELARVDPGFDAARVLTFRVSGGYAETANYDRLIQRIDTAIGTLRALPGVVSVATSMTLPGVSMQLPATFGLVEGRSETEPPMVAETRVVSRDYFAVVRIPLLAGEWCPDRMEAAVVNRALVNRAFATRYLSGRSPVGLHLATDGQTAWDQPRRIVGIVDDARESGLDREPGPTVYSCSSVSGPVPYFLVRTSGEPLVLATAVRERMKDLEPLRSVYDIATLDDRIGDAFALNRARTVLLVAFAAAALSLACVGIYGTLTYVVNQRRREAGLRLALGATRGSIVRQFLTQGMRVAGVACLCGLALSAVFARALSGMLYGVSPLDPATFAAVVGIVTVVTVLAALVPAIRASLVTPMRVLREE